jgi:hypothetical protein
VFVTYEGSPSARFQRAISRGDMMGAETAAFELTSLSLHDALALVALYARADDRKFDRAAVRWLRRLLQEQPLMLSEAQRAADWLAQLRGDDGDLAAGSLGSLLHGFGSPYHPPQAAS